MIVIQNFDCGLMWIGLGLVCRKMGVEKWSSWENGRMCVGKMVR